MKIYQIIEKIIIFLNKTLLSGYRAWKWEQHTKVEGGVISSPDEYVTWLKEMSDK